MPTINLLAPDTDLGTLFLALTAMDQANIVFQSDTLHIFGGAGRTFRLTGTGLASTPGGILTGGTIDQIEITEGGSTYVLTDLDLSAATLGTAWNADRTGANPSALETLFLGLDYLVNGTTGADFHIAAGLSDDGQSLQTTGAIEYLLGNGDDSVSAAGARNDTISGEAGNDTLGGNGGDDRLFGGSGLDLLYGGGGNDILDGGLSVDTLYGGNGNDIFQHILGHFGAQTYGGSGTDLLDLSGWTGGPTGFQVSLQLETYAFRPNAFGADGTYVLEGVENVRGSDFDDNLNGGTGANVLEGGDGNDTLFGVGGNDVLFGGGGNDEVLGGAENDFLFGDADDDQMSGETGNDSLDGGTGNDDLNGDIGNDTLRGGSGNDSLFGGSNDDALFGDANVDTIYGDTGNDRIDGGSGKDISYGGTGDDVFLHTGTNFGSDTYGGDGTDLLDLSGWTGISRAFVDLGSETYAIGDNIFGADGIYILQGVENVTGTNGGDTIIGGPLSNELLGRSGNDIMIGGGGVDTLYGGVGDDTLDGGADRDISYGGNGDDVFVHGAQTLGADVYGGNNVDALDLSTWGALTSGFVINLQSETYRFNTEPVDPSSTLVLSSVENVTASDANDIITGSVLANLVVAGDGEDVVDGGGGDDTILGGENDDLLRGGADDDDLFGGDGSDTFFGGTGDDFFNGGTDLLNGDTVSYSQATGSVEVYLLYTGRDVGGGQGNDTLNAVENLTGSAFDDRLSGDADDNRLEGGNGNDILNGKGGADRLEGGNGADKLTTGAEEDDLFGGLGNDTMFALAGNDYLEAGDGDDFVYGGRDDDSIFGGTGNDQLRGNIGNDTLTGDGGTDDLRGGAGNDRLFGEVDDDVLFGGSGNDTVSGGAGNDTLTGGAGGGVLDGARDSFVYRDSSVGGGGFDRVKDFENGIDVLDLTAMGYASFAEVQAIASFTAAGMRLDVGLGDVLFIEGLTLAQFGASDVLL